MKATLDLKACPLVVSEGLQDLLNKVLEGRPNGVGGNNTAGEGKSYAFTFNFRDPSYDAENGGYHPVEIRIERTGDLYQLSYITDFSYVGIGYQAELAKEIDFDFSQGVCEVRMLPPVPVKDAEELYSLFEGNFISYYQMGVFEVTVEQEG